MWVGTIQSVEGLSGTKRWRKGEVLLSSFTGTSIFCPQKGKEGFVTLKINNNCITHFNKLKN